MLFLKLFKESADTISEGIETIPLSNCSCKNKKIYKCHYLEIQYGIIHFIKMS